jgi:general secretion pathway protein G
MTARCCRLQSLFARGFTLLELLVVLVILGLLASYVAPRYFGQIGKSETQVARAQIDAFAKALDQYRIDIGSYPSTEDGLTALFRKPTTAGPRWMGPYLQKEPPVDPWGRSYVYRAAPGQNDYELLTLGKDGQAGGDNENADIRR